MHCWLVPHDFNFLLHLASHTSVLRHCILRVRLLRACCEEGVCYCRELTVDGGGIRLLGVVLTLLC